MSEVSHLKEVMKLRLDSADKALELQAKEVERRLKILNGEAERLREIQAMYVPREVYESERKELTKKLDALTKIVYIGLGIVLALQFVLKFIV